MKISSFIFILVSFIFIPIASAADFDDEYFDEFEDAPLVEATVNVVKNKPILPALSEKDEYLIGVHDLLEVEVFQVENLTRTVRVNSRGSISLPLVGRIRAANLSSEALEKEIGLALEKEFLQEAFISVFIKEYASQRVTIEGAVNKPGIYPLTGKTTVLQTIALAAGFTDLADSSAVLLYRKNKNRTSSSYVLNVEAIRKGEAEDPVIKGDDIIVVHQAPIKTFVTKIANALRGFVSLGTYNLFNN